MKRALLLWFLFACGPAEDFEEETAFDESAVAAINHDDRFVVVVDVNWENLPTPGERPCAGEYRDLIFWMKQQALSPDFVIVQQVSGRGQANHLANTMSELLAGEWRAIVAEANPARMNSPCGGPKAFQTNAILYRPGHFEPVGAKRVFQTFIGARDGGVRLNTQARTKTVVQRFRDKRNDKTLSVGSTHWATANSNGTPKSALASVKRVVNNLDDSGGDLRIWGGDTNMTDLSSPGRASSTFRDWYQAANGEVAAAAPDGTKFNYRDAAFADCDGSKKCLTNQHFTIGGDRRIDFLMASKGSLPRIDQIHTVGFGEAGNARRSGDNPNLRYSDHRAVRARIWY